LGYEFKQNVIVTCASWNEILKLIGEILYIIEKIIGHEKIIGIEHIKDDYSDHYL